MGGYGMRRLIRAGHASYVPIRLGSLPAAFHGPLQSDLVLLSGRTTGNSFSLGTELCWIPAALDAGAALILLKNDSLPRGTRPLDEPVRRVEVIEASVPPISIPEPAIDDVAGEIGERVAALLPDGALVQYGPGAVGGAVLSAVRSPIRVWSGVVTDSLVALDRRGLLEGSPRATYAVGTSELYDWIDGRETLVRVETTHDVTALAAGGIWAINTALEIDLTGQVNVEYVGSDVIAGVGGHADFAMAGARSVSGASVIALPSRRGQFPTLVDRLDGPTSTTRSDVDIVVTESGTADLRGLDDAERRRALSALWGV